jgi:hypothetical protein
MKEDFQLKFKNFVKRITKHAKWAVSFRIKNNETCETGCFAKFANFAKLPVCFVKQRNSFRIEFRETKSPVYCISAIVHLWVSASAINLECSGWQGTIACTSLSWYNKPTTPSEMHGGTTADMDCHMKNGLWLYIWMRTNYVLK